MISSEPTLTSRLKLLSHQLIGCPAVTRQSVVKAVVSPTERLLFVVYRFGRQHRQSYRYKMSNQVSDDLELLEKVNVF